MRKESAHGVCISHNAFSHLDAWEGGGAVEGFFVPHHFVFSFTLFLKIIPMISNLAGSVTVVWQSKGLAFIGNCKPAE